jgi:hypothetical protein
MVRVVYRGPLPLATENQPTVRFELGEIAGVVGGAGSPRTWC